jgi:hypothetical protein
MITPLGIVEAWVFLISGGKSGFCQTPGQPVRSHENTNTKTRRDLKNLFISPN